MMRPLVVAVLLFPGPLASQGASYVAEGRAVAGQHPERALEWYHRALALDSLDYEANWRTAVALVDLGQDTPDSVRSNPRDSLFIEALSHARRAVEADSSRPEGFFTLAMSLGRVALTKSKKDRVRYAIEIYDAANRTLALAPDHDGAHHILGLWHAEGRRASGINRFLAKTMLGGGILGKSNWDEAIEHLERAVRLDPGRIYHRLDLARVYADRKRYTDARTQLGEIEALPNQERHDSIYRTEAQALREAIAKKKDDKPTAPPGNPTGAV